MRSKSLTIVYNIIVLLSFLLSFYISFVVGIIFFAVFTIFFRRTTELAYLFPIIVLSIVSFTNYSDWQSGDYDIVRYYETWQIFSDTSSFKEAMSVIYLLNKDYVFYFIEYLLTLIFPSDPRWFGFIFTCLISYIHYFTFKRIARNNNCYHIVYRPISLLIFFLAFFCVIRFYDYTNAYRQHFAFACLALIATSNIKTRTKNVLMLLTTTIHWSMIIIVIVYNVLLLKLFKNRHFIILSLSLFAGVIVVPILTRIFSNNELIMNYLLGEELGIDRTLTLIMLITTILASFLVTKIKLSNEIVSFILSLAIITALFFTRSTIIIRTSFNWTALLVSLSPVLFYICRSKRYTKYKIYMLGIWSLFIFYNILTINRGTFEYKIFTDYGTLMSVKNIINTINPF